MVTRLWLTLLFLVLAGDGLAVAERGVVLVRDTDGEETALYRGSYALLIGVSDYTRGWPDLESVPSELDRVERTLRAQGFTTVKSLNPNARQLEGAFEDFIKKYGFDTDNRLLFYFAGHGHTRKRTKGYLVPADAPDPNQDEKGFLRNALDMSQIIAWSRHIEAKHVLFLFDSCFSGTVFKARALSEQPRHITALTREPVRQYITAGSAGETVPAKSTFNQVFVDGLEHRLADLDKDGFVTGTELGYYIQSTVTKHVVSQTPQFGKHPDYELSLGDFVFALGVPSIRDEAPQKPARLTVRSNVHGDTLYIDDEPRGSTGPKAHELAPGTYKVRVAKDGHRSFLETVELTAGEERVLRTRLSPLPKGGRPYRGIRVGDWKDERGQPAGGLIEEVIEGTPAAAAGLRPGDVILGIDGRDVRVGLDVYDVVVGARIGSRVEVYFRRDGQERRSYVVLEELPRDGPREAERFSIPVADIRIDGAKDDWRHIPPLLVDPPRDQNPAADFAGTDLHELYLARDGEFLYVLITLHDGSPKTGATTVYFVLFKQQPHHTEGDRDTQATFEYDNRWVGSSVRAADGRPLHMMGPYPPHYVAPGRNLVEWKMPLRDLGDLDEKYIQAYIHVVAPRSHPTSDETHSLVRIVGH